MKTGDKRVCEVCGSLVPETSDACPVCVLRGALNPEDTKTGSSFDPSASQSDLRFEHYQVLKNENGTPIELGRGAMGVTYKALDVSLRCVVALKVINARFVGDESARRRFVREARAAASVRHPHVASVFHLGLSANGYFYAMEFVDGEPLDRVIRRSGRLEPLTALQIVALVSGGLEAVLKQNLVHRDIKPSNIMVSFQGDKIADAKIIDLGLAKGAQIEADSISAVSTQGTFVGTPAYASPEQFAGIGTDIRSDLYSLGITFWEALSGKLPFQGSALELMRQHQHAALPTEQLTGVPMPIVSLLEILLEKDPDLRFQTPAQLGNGLAKVREAISSGSSLSVRELRSDNHKTIEQSPKGKPRKHTVRWLAASGLALAGSLLILSIALSVRLSLNEQHSNEQLQALQVKFEKLQEGVNSFAEVQNSVRQDQPGEKPDELERHTYVELGKELGLDPAMLMQQLPRFAEELKKTPNATTYERANAAYVGKDYKEAERLALAAADEAQRAGPSKNEEAIKALELAGWSAEKRIEYAEALARLRDAEKLTDRTRDPLDWARVQFAIAVVLVDQGQYGDAERTFRAVLQERERVLGSENPDTLAARSHLENAFFYEGKYAESEAEARALLAIQEKVHGLEHPDTLKARNNLASTLSYEGKYAGAETEFRTLIKLKEKVFGPEEPNTLRSRNNLAAMLGMEGKYAEAEAEFRPLVTLYEKVFGPENPSTLNIRFNLAQALDNEGKYIEAETEDRSVLKLDEKVLGPEHPDSLDTRGSLALVLLHQGKYMEAEGEGRQAVKLEEKVLGPEHPNTLDTRNNLAEVLDHEGKYAEAEAEDRAVLRLREKILTPEHPDTLRTCFNLAVCLRSEGKIQEASALAQHAADEARKVLGPEHPDTKMYEQLCKDLEARAAENP
jgi:serine/threonine protein kinase